MVEAWRRQDNESRSIQPWGGSHLRSLPERRPERLPNEAQRLTFRPDQNPGIIIRACWNRLISNAGRPIAVTDTSEARSEDFFRSDLFRGHLIPSRIRTDTFLLRIK
jgi:hypothetical protein